MIFFRKIVGDSMSPTILHGSIIIGFEKKPKVDDIVAARVDGRDIVKRVREVSDRRIFLIGDNEKASTDSKTYGYLPISSVLGVVAFHIRLPS